MEDLGHLVALLDGFIAFGDEPVALLDEPVDARPEPDVPEHGQQNDGAQHAVIEQRGRIEVGHTSAANRVMGYWLGIDPDGVSTSTYCLRVWFEA